MNVAILSGKGGTGKTTVSTNLAITLGTSYVDCDVEEPNGFIFLNPDIISQKEVFVKYPIIDQQKCVLCGACASVCQFNALAKAGKEIVVFEKLCHSCEACKLVCRTDAIGFEKRSIGMIENGKSKEINCYRGILNIGEPMAVPILRKLLKELPEENYLLDCPPGTSCNVVATIKYANFAILVTEPSAFGLHDLKLAEELVKLYNIPYGIIINKDDGQDNLIKCYCRKNMIPLFGIIPYSMKAATLYSKGIMLCDDDLYQKKFVEIVRKIKEAFAW